MNAIADYFHLSLDGQPSPIEIPGATRDDLPHLFATLGFTTGAEIGVWEGAYSEQLCQANPALQLLCVDPYAIYADYRDNNQQHRMHKKWEMAHERLAPYQATFVRKYSAEAAKDIPEASLDFVYIDGNHAFEYVAMDLALWGRRVKPGGIIAGHDYYNFPRHTWCHVVEAVHGYVQACRITPWFVLGTRREARAAQLQHRYRSYAWVNPEHPKSRNRWAL